MAKRIGAYDTYTAKIVLDVVRYLRDSGFVIPQHGRGNQFIPPDAYIYVRNDSGEEVPAFACMQVTGTVESGGQNYIKVNKPTDTNGDDGRYLFNGVAPIEAGGYGVAYDGPFVRMLTDGSSITVGDLWEPEIGQWTVTPGGTQFSAVGADDIKTDVMRAFILGGGVGSGKIFFTVDSAAVAGTSSPYNGNVILTSTVIVAPCNQFELVGTSVDIIDWSTCLANAELLAALVGREGWAFRGIAQSLASGAPANTPTPCHWVLDGLCCP